MPEKFAQINDDVLEAMRSPRPAYYLVLVVLGAGALAFFTAWSFQVKAGMGVAGINSPVGWGVYIANFVFWVGIAHSGTLISAILHLVRSKWRSSVSRAAEAMTVFAVMTAGLFPLIHLGRLWVFYYIIPYPSQRQLWPNFTSPLVWDVVAVTTYLTVSMIFWYVGMVPDLASARDRWRRLWGADHPRTRFYRRFSLGWVGSGSQWSHYGRGYLFFAALATPLVVSVHSVVSWDFAMSLLPGWHTTIFPPYFVAGAIHSGLAMVLTLLIPLRRILHLENVITPRHLDAVGKTLIVTTCIVGYAYIVEPFIAWYSGNIFEQDFAWFRATGWIGWLYWLQNVCNVLIPLMLVFKRVRKSILALFLIGLAVNIGMWLERGTIVIGSTSHDFLPHAWDDYGPTYIEATITVGSFCFFLFWFFLFSKFLPTVASSEVKETHAEHWVEDGAKGRAAITPDYIAKSATGVLAVYDQESALKQAAIRAKEQGRHELETFSPIRLEWEPTLLGRRKSPVRFFTLTGGLLGMISGFLLCVMSADVNDLVVGGKLTPIAFVPYFIVAFEGTVLLGTIGNLIGVIVYSRLRPKAQIPEAYLAEFSRDKFGLYVACAPHEITEVTEMLRGTEMESVAPIGVAG